MPASVLAVAIIALAPATPEKFPTRLAPAPSSGDNERTPADAAPYASRLGARLSRAGALRREQVLAVAADASQFLPRACPTPRTAGRRISARWRNRSGTSSDLPRRPFALPASAASRQQMTQARALPPSRSRLPRSDRLGLRCPRNACRRPSLAHGAFPQLRSIPRILSCTREKARLG